MASDRRFASWLLIAFGPLFMLGGFVAAFTVEGAIYPFLGLGMLLTGVLLRTRLPLGAAVLAGAAVFAALAIQMSSERA